MRMHLGAHIAQAMNGWTDRETEEMVRYHAGVRILCGLEESFDDTDRTSIEGFRTQLGPNGEEALNQITVLHASGAGFTGSGWCAADTTVQESPIAYPTEVGHLKNISEKLLGIGRRMKTKATQQLSALHQKAKDVFTEIRLFTRGKADQALARKIALSNKLYKIANAMIGATIANLSDLSRRGQTQASSEIEFYKQVMRQIQHWFKTGFHPKDKIVSLWEKAARPISKGKVGKKCEFGRRWIITRLMGGYVIGSPCQKLGADTDTSIADEVMINFLNTFGTVPEAFVYDRGADSSKNDQFLKDIGVEQNCIFPKGKKKMNVTENVRRMAQTERALNEATIANIKHSKYNFTKPRARSTQTCELKGQFAMLGFNTNQLFRDISKLWEIEMEIT